jgi:AcrR family transcriptional regulator
MTDIRGAREAAKEETREALLLAGLAEFAERGLDAPSLDAICARAGYTRGAFYVHFKDRDEFLVAAMERVLGPFVDAVVARGEETHDLERTVERFVTTVLGMMRLATGSEGGAVPLHRLLDACERSGRLRERFARILTEAMDRVARSARVGQKGGAVRADVDARQMGSILVALALGAIVSLELGIEVDLEAAGKTVLDLVAVEPSRRRRV